MEELEGKVVVDLTKHMVIKFINRVVSHFEDSLPGRNYIDDSEDVKVSDARNDGVLTGLLYAGEILGILDEALDTELDWFVNDLQGEYRERSLALQKEKDIAPSRVDFECSDIADELCAKFRKALIGNIICLSSSEVESLSNTAE